MPIRSLIIDDEPLARSLLLDYSTKIPYLEIVGAFANPIQALDLLHNEKIDLLFLDIQMPELTGISFLKILINKPRVILTTAYSQYALEGFDLDVLDYLLKPITFERFLKSVNKARTQIDTKTLVGDEENKAFENKTLIHQPFVFIKDGTKTLKIYLADILFIEGLKDYVIIYTLHQKITSLQRMKNLEEILPPDLFMRIHHSFIISLSKIEVITKSEVQIGEHKIPISEGYKKDLKEYIERNNL